MILYHLLTQGPLRFGALRRLVSRRCSQQALTNQLRELEVDGVVDRQVYPQTLPKVEYSLTSLGESVRPLLFGLCEWGKTYQAQLPDDTSLAPTGAPVASTKTC